MDLGPGEVAMSKQKKCGNCKWWEELIEGCPLDGTCTVRVPPWVYDDDDTRDIHRDATWAKECPCYEED